MKLSEHFDLSEFTRSSVAERNHIDNHIDLSVPSGQAVLANLKNLCEQVLEPLRQHFGVPVIISSGYRSTALNRAVGGVSTSQHQKGEAADIVLPSALSSNSSALKDWFNWLHYNTHFDQLIWEKSGSKTWIHVSCRLDVTLNRQQSISRCCGSHC
ncbi:MAG: D-Ala-D-Ala carboxypeptidase family metallohydrolase [Paludibacteraceae bacterium]|nr:D-Ala-D-Ala carboxypeptidase family metallohydrolase [Paludibacteraceae bacterium]